MLDLQQKIEKRLRRCLPVLQNKYGVQRLGLFGNLLRDPTAKPNEIEIVLEDDQELGLAFFEMQNFIAEQLGYPVTLIYLRNLKPAWKAAILQEVQFLDDDHHTSVPISPKKLAQLYLADLQETLTTIATYLRGYSFDDFAHDDLRMDAVIYNLITLSKIAQRLPESVRRQAPDLPWSQMIADGARLMENYSELNIAELWNFCTQELPMMHKKLTALANLAIA